MKVGKLYYFEWLDAFSNSAWKDKSDATKWFKEQEGYVKECGWLVYKDTETLGFVSRKSDWKKQHLY